MIRFAHVFRINKQVEDGNNSFARVLENLFLVQFLHSNERIITSKEFLVLKIYNLAEMIYVNKKQRAQLIWFVPFQLRPR